MTNSSRNRDYVAYLESKAIKLEDKVIKLEEELRGYRKIQKEQQKQGIQDFTPFHWAGIFLLAIFIFLIIHGIGSIFSH
jgi:hypothetical protein